MSMSGMQIYKLLPKTNCRECGVPTCLAFAMKLASGKVELAQCPHASDEAKAALGAAAEPPIRGLKLGAAEHVIGLETVLYRHQKRFFQPPLLALRLADGSTPDSCRQQVQQIRELAVERVGQRMHPEAVFVHNAGGELAPLMDLAQQVAAQAPELVQIIHSERAELLCTLSERLDEIGVKAPVLGFATAENWEQLCDVRCGALAVRGKSLEETAELAHKLHQRGRKDLILAPPAASARELMGNFTALRRVALDPKRPSPELGFPLMGTIDLRELDRGAVDASTALCKYASLLVLGDVEHTPRALVTALLLLRQHLYTDPQKPIQVEPKLYELGEVDARTPVYVTSNFSLTYFLVSSEIEGSGRPGYLAVLDTEGMGVLTGWAAGKFTAEAIAGFLKNCELDQRLEQRRVVIPGYVAGIRGELEDNLPGWEICVGPQEAQDIPAYVKNTLEA